MNSIEQCSHLKGSGLCFSTLCFNNSSYVIPSKLHNLHFTVVLHFGKCVWYVEYVAKICLQNLHSKPKLPLQIIMCFRKCSKYTNFFPHSSHVTAVLDIFFAFWMLFSVSVESPPPSIPLPCVSEASV